MHALTFALSLALIVTTAGWIRASAQDERPLDRVRTMNPERIAGGYIIEHDNDVAREEPGTHKGGGQTVGYSFFRNAKDLKLVFRKRALKPGSAIGYHEQHEDEIYYVLSGRGIMKLDGKEVEVGPGTAVLTRPGSSHSIKQVGTEDLVILINYEAR